MQLMPALKKRLEKESTVGNLPALTGILTDLQRFTSDPTVTIGQISEQVSRDPSLSVRLLHMANSAYFNRSEEVVSIEDAVLFLGIEQIRMVSMSMACVEKMSPQEKSGFEWLDFWRHCIATAYFTRMIGRFFVRPQSDPEMDYMAGLLHDVGKLVIAMLIPEGFGYILTKAQEEKISFSDAERAYFDTDHGSLGGWYLERQKVPPQVSEAVRCHHNWTLSVANQDLPAIVNVADAFTHECGIGTSGCMQENKEPFTETAAWYFLLQHGRLRSDVAVLEMRLRSESERLHSLVEIILPKPKTSPASAHPKTKSEPSSTPVKIESPLKETAALPSEVLVEPVEATTALPEPIPPPDTTIQSIAETESEPLSGDLQETPASLPPAQDLIQPALQPSPASVLHNDLMPAENAPPPVLPGPSPFGERKPRGEETPPAPDPSTQVESIPAPVKKIDTENPLLKSTL